MLVDQKASFLNNSNYDPTAYNNSSDTQWAGGTNALCNIVLRDEWGASNDHVEGGRTGSHLEMPTTGGDSDLELVQAVKDGKISEVGVDGAYLVNSGLAFTLANLTAIFFGECINFPLQRGELA